MKLILSGNHEQFLYYCRKNNINPRDRNIKRIQDIHSIIGLPIDTEVIQYGTWYENRDELIDGIRMRFNNITEYKDE